MTCPWHHNVQQYTLLEYASLKQTCPEGIYLSLRPGAPAQWSGVYFVRKGPYAPAILRFQLSFPPGYPNLPPSITFISDIFHPLVAPLTTYTYTTGTSSSETVSASDEGRLPPGGFSLRHGFPHWFGRAQMSTASSAKSSRDVSKAHGCMLSQDDYLAKLATEDSSSHVSSLRSQSPRASNAQDQSRQWTLHDKPTPISDVLQYVKRTFDDETALDSLPLEAAGNTGAWKAWRAFRRSNNQNNGLSAPETGLNTHVEWSWDGVWEERVRKGIDASTAESTLYGSMAGDDLIRFVDLADDLEDEVKAVILSPAGGS